MRSCPGCGLSLDEDAIFCPTCGWQKTTPTTQTASPSEPETPGAVAEKEPATPVAGGNSRLGSLMRIVLGLLALGLIVAAANVAFPYLNWFPALGSTTPPHGYGQFYTTEPRIILGVCLFLAGLAAWVLTYWLNPRSSVGTTTQPVVKREFHWYGRPNGKRLSLREWLFIAAMFVAILVVRWLTR